MNPELTKLQCPIVVLLSGIEPAVGGPILNPIGERTILNYNVDISGLCLNGVLDICAGGYDLTYADESGRLVLIGD